MNRSSVLVDESQATTFWEVVGLKRWSQYLTSIEKAVLSETMARFERPGKAIEIGCDGGRWSRLLASHGWDMTCIDVNPESLELCRERVPSARTVLADPEAVTYPLEGADFDLLVAIQVPPAHEAWFANEAARLLVRGGYVVFDVTNAASFKSHLSNIRARLTGEAPFYGHRFVDVQANYQKAGFDFQESTGYAWAPFSRKSDSRLIPLVTRLEELTGLRRFVKHAPWVISIAHLSST